MGRRRKCDRGHPRAEAIITYLVKNPKSTCNQIVEGATFRNGKLLRSHGRLGMPSREMTMMLSSNPILFKREANPRRGNGGLLWSVQEGVEPMPSTKRG